MEEYSGNESDFEFEDSGSEEEDIGDEYQINRLWTRVHNADDHQYPHQIVDFAEDMGPIDPPDADSQPIEFFNLFAVPETGKSLIEILVQETNRYAAQYFENDDYVPTPHSRSNEWEDTDCNEMSAFLGLYLSMGIVKKPSIESYWNNTENSYLYNTPGFSSVMTRNRFQLIMKFLHCNNNQTHILRGQEGHDPCHKFRPVLDLANYTFKQRYAAARDLTIDESMVGFKGRHDIVQYLPAKKTHRWGAKFFVLAESDTGYILSLKLYTGRQGSEERTNNGLGYDVCMNLIQPFLYKYHHFIVDNYYTSPTLCDALFSKDTYMTGTVRVYRRGMPRSLRGIRLQKREMEIRQSGHIMALAYGDRKTVTLLSSMASPRVITTQNARGTEVNIPLVNDLYNRKMGGVDLSDKAVQGYDPDTRTNKMWKRILVNILLKMMNNAYIVYRQRRGLRPKMQRLDFYQSVYQSLVGEYRQLRRRPGPQPSLDRLTGRHFVDVIDGSKRKVCRLCDRRVRTWCAICKTGLCVRGCFRTFHTVKDFRQNHQEE